MSDKPIIITSGSTNFTEDDGTTIIDNTISITDIDDTEFDWKNHANFKLFDSLIYIKDGELILDANTQINIINDY